MDVSKNNYGPSSIILNLTLCNNTLLSILCVSMGPDIFRTG